MTANTMMTDGANERLDAQIAEALFGQPGMSKMDVANRVRELRGDGPALLVQREMGQADALLREVCAQLESLDCGACIGSHAPMEDLHGRIARHLSAQPSPGGQDALVLPKTREELIPLALEVIRQLDLIDGHYDAAIEKCKADLAARQPVDEVSVKKEDANNYCLILRALGMEEEGDPVAEVKALIEARDRQPVGQEPAMYQVRPRSFDDGEGWREVTKREYDDRGPFPGYDEAEWERRTLYAAPPAQADQEYLESLDRALEGVIDQRDRYHETADDLAGHIASITGVDIGEHSSANCPWQNAIHAAEEYQPAQAVDLGMPIAMIDQALGHLSTALEDLHSSPDARPGAMVTEAMGCLRQALTGVQP